MGKKRRSSSDPVEYPNQKPSEAGQAVQSRGYRYLCRFGYKPFVQCLERIFDNDSLLLIVKEHVPYLKDFTGFGNHGLALIITIYLMQLLSRDERGKYERLIRIINDIPRKGFWLADWLPTLDFIRNGEGLLSLTRALLGDKVEWPMIKALSNVAPVSPLVCVDLVPSGTYVDIQFTISKPPPTVSKCNYVMFLYCLQNTPSEYDTFITNNATVIPEILSVSNDKLKKYIISSMSKSEVSNPKVFEFLKSEVDQPSASFKSSWRKIGVYLPVEGSTNVNAEVTHKESSAHIEEPVLAWEANPNIAVKTNDLEISMLQNFNVLLNDEWFLSVNSGSAVFLIEDYMLQFDGRINTLSIERMDMHKDLKPHILQIAEAIVDLDEWATLTGTPRWPVVSADSVKKAFFKKKRKYDDIESIGITLPLKCPLTMVRLKTPVRGSYCRHLTCFDSRAIPLLTSNERFFACPSCNKGLSEIDLVIDGYVQDILSKTENNVDDVTIDSKSGEWRIKNCGSQVLESSGEEQMMPKIPRINEPFVPDSFEHGSSDFLTGSSITDAILID